MMSAGLLDTSRTRKGRALLALLCLVSSLAFAQEASLDARLDEIRETGRYVPPKAMSALAKIEKRHVLRHPAPARRIHRTAGLRLPRHRRQQEGHAAGRGTARAGQSQSEQSHHRQGLAVEGLHQLRQ
ncbi:hypothetical protein LP419_27325 [Massilia sp. H-1]|nr:hypothetical protein LP419_27325 [Massilia sp. H-1]